MVLPAQQGLSSKPSEVFKLAKILRVSQNSQHGNLNKMRGSGSINKVRLGLGVSLNDVTT